jgi:hypothetical protein
VSRYRADEVQVTVTAHGSRLLVRWASADHFHDILVGFRAALPRHGDCCWNGGANAWSVSTQGRSRLEQWLGLTFEPSCVEWLDNEPAGYGTGRTSSYRSMALLAPAQRERVWGFVDRSGGTGAPRP